MYEPFLGRIEIIRVRVWRRRRENGEEEKRKKEKCSEKWESPDLVPFMKRLNRVGSKPTHFPLSVAVRCRFSGSGSIQRLWGVLEIRIHQRMGWISIHWAFVFFSFTFLIFLLVAPILLLSEPLGVSNFLQKILKKLLCVSWCMSSCFVVFSLFFLHG